jgi:hypothetical protein
MQRVLCVTVALHTGGILTMLINTALLRCCLLCNCMTVYLVTARPRAATCQEALWCHAVSPVFFGYSYSNHTCATTTAAAAAAPLAPAIVAAESTALSVITSSDSSSTAAGTATAITTASSGIESWKLTAEDRLEVR